MPTYKEPDHALLSAKYNLKHVVNHVNKFSENCKSNEAVDYPDQKAYVVPMGSEFEGKEVNMGSSTENLLSQNAKDEDSNVPNLENVHFSGVAQELMHKNSTDPKMQSTSKANHSKLWSKFTVPQPFDLATDKRASGTCKFVAANPSPADKKQAKMNNMELPSVGKENQGNLHLDSRKPVQLENSKTVFGDNVSVVSLATASAKSFKRTTAMAPIFRVSERAEKWKVFQSKLEQKNLALEAERLQNEARKKEEEEAALKELRKSMNFKAMPMPSFYHEELIPKAELKKVPPTRAKSPRFARRKSFGDAYNPPLVRSTRDAGVRQIRRKNEAAPPHSLGVERVQGARSSAAGSESNPLDNA